MYKRSKLYLNHFILIIRYKQLMAVAVQLVGQNFLIYGLPYYLPNTLHNVYETRNLKNSMKHPFTSCTLTYTCSQYILYACILLQYIIPSL